MYNLSSVDMLPVLKSIETTITEISVCKTIEGLLILVNVRLCSVRIVYFITDIFCYLFNDPSL